MADVTGIILDGPSGRGPAALSAMIVNEWGNALMVDGRLANEHRHNAKTAMHQFVSGLLATRTFERLVEASSTEQDSQKTLLLSQAFDMLSAATRPL